FTKSVVRIRFAMTPSTLTPCENVSPKWAYTSFMSSPSPISHHKKRHSQHICVIPESVKVGEPYTGTGEVNRRSAQEFLSRPSAGSQPSVFLAGSAGGNAGCIGATACTGVSAPADGTGGSVPVQFDGIGGVGSLGPKPVFTTAGATDLRVTKTWE